MGVAFSLQREINPPTAGGVAGAGLLGNMVHFPLDDFYRTRVRSLATLKTN